VDAGQRLRTPGGLGATQWGAGPSLVAVHGFAAHAGVWRPLAQRLTGHRLVCPDLPGFGASAAVPAVSWEPASIAADVARLAPNATWIGWSLGGLVALAAALQAPAGVRRLVLLSATPRFLRGDDGWACGMEPAAFDAFRAGVGGDPGRAVSRFLALCMQGDRHGSTALRDLRRLVAPVSLGRESLLAALDVLAATDLRKRLAELSCPVLIVHGANDAVVPVCASEELARRVPASTLERMPGAGHAPHVSHPELVAEVVQRFLAGADTVEKQHS